MNHRTHIVRWIIAGTGALALAGAGAGMAAASSSPPTAPVDSGPTGAGPSDCAVVPAETEAPAGSAAPGDSAAPASSSAPASSAAPTNATTGSDTDGSAAAMTGPFVQIEETEEYGPILVDHECRTLYGFTKDQPGTSSCVEACAEAWPALTVADGVVPPLADELDPTLFSVIEHPESGPMLQVGDWPLYYFANDAAPGDLNGQGVGGVWWLVAPDGTLIEESSESSAPSASDTAGAAASMPMGTAVAGSDGADDTY